MSAKNIEWDLPFATLLHLCSLFASMGTYACRRRGTILDTFAHATRISVPGGSCIRYRTSQKPSVFLLRRCQVFMNRSSTIINVDTIFLRRRQVTTKVFIAKVLGSPTEAAQSRTTMPRSRRRKPRRRPRVLSFVASGIGSKASVRIGSYAGLRCFFIRCLLGPGPPVKELASSHAEVVMCCKNPLLTSLS